VISIVTDSSACLPPSLPAPVRSRVRVVPIVIHLAHEDVTGDDPTVARRVYLALRRGEPVKSSAPTVVEYVDALDRTGGGAVVVTPAAEFTAMSGNASLAAELTRTPARVIDSRTAAAAQGLVAAVGAEAAAAGGSLEDVGAAVEDAASRARLVALIDDLAQIQRSGRVSPLVLPTGSAPARPVFRLRDGLVEHLAVSRSEGSIDTLVQEAEREGWRRGARSLVFCAIATDRAESLRRSLSIEDPPVEFSPSMGIHTGPGVVGLAWLAPAA
jgi:DegV family protein with EDD domain